MEAGAELDTVLTDAGWDEIDFDDKPTNTYFATSPDVAGLSLRVLSESSVSVAFKPFDEGDIDSGGDTETGLVMAFQQPRS